MRTKNNINKDKNNKLIPFSNDSNNSNNVLLNQNNIVSSFVLPSELLYNNNIQTEYKSSFFNQEVQKEYQSKYFNKDKIFTISNSRRNIPYKTKEPIKKVYNNDTEIKNDKYQTKLIKEMKYIFTNNNNTNNRNNSNHKYDVIKKKFLNKIKDGNSIFIQNTEEDKYNKINKYSNIIKYHENNTTRASNNTKQNLNYNYNIYNNKRESKKNNYQIKIFKNSYDKERKFINNLNLRGNIKPEIYKYNTIDGNNNKKQLNIKDNTCASSTKRESNINKLKKLRISENKKMNKNKKISELTLDENELKILTKKKTFIEKNNSLKFKNILNDKTINEEENEKKDSKSQSKSKSKNKKLYYPYFLESYGKDKNKYITNKRKILIRNNKKANYSNLYIGKNSSNNNIASETQKSKKDKINNNKNKVEEYKNKSKSNSKSNKKIYKNIILKGKNAISAKSTTSGISKKDSEKNINNKNSKKVKNKNINIKLKSIKTNIIENNKNDNNYINDIKNNYINFIDNEDLNFVLNESENKNPVNIIKTNNFDVNKPKENNLKYTLLKEFEDEEENKNINKSQIENIVIGIIEGYTDILENDKLNKKHQLRSKSSFDGDKQMTKKLIKTKNNKDIKHLKTTSNKKLSLVNMHILDDNSSEIEDLDFDSNDYGINNHLINLENDYEFEDMPTFENETKINNEDNLLPFCVSKISFCKYYDKDDGNYKINENIDTDILSLEKINKELNILNDKYNYSNYKKHSMLNDNDDNNLKHKNIKKNTNTNIINNNRVKKSPYKNNNQRKTEYCSRNNINNNYVNKYLNYKNPPYNTDKKYNYSKNNLLNTNINNNNDNIIKKKLNKKHNYNYIYNDNESIKKKYIKTSTNSINYKDKNDLKIVSNYGDKENCFII